MNIQQLLTTFQSAGASNATPETTATSSAGFQRALGAAASALSDRFTLGDDNALATDAEGEQALAALLDGLDIELDAGALAELLADLGIQTEATLPGTTLDAAGIAADDGTTDETSGLDHIAQRLALMAAFAEPAPSSAPSASPQGVKQIAELLVISEGDAATLISALQGQRDARPAVDSMPRPAANSKSYPAVDFASRAAPFALASAPLVTQPQPTMWQPAAPLLDAAPTLRAEPATPVWSSMAILAAPLTTRAEEPSTSMAPLVGAADAAAPRLPMSPVPTAQTSVAAPVQSPAWPHQVVQFIQRGGEQHVQMQLHPAELGPLSIALTVGEQGTQAHFVSAHAQVRQVLEHVLPQLREALAEQGITLSDTSVGDQRRDQQEAFAEPAPSSAPSASPQGVKQIAELLAISEGDAASLIAALQGQRDARPAADSASRAAPFALASAPLATQAQATTWQPATPLDAAATLRTEPTTPAWSSMATLAAPLTTSAEEPSTSMAPLVGAADAAAPRLPMSPVPTAQASVATPVQSPAWPHQVGQQLVQFIQRGGEQHVQMQLHPAELGPLSVALTVGEQGTQAHFVSAHAQVRQVLEHALPQLREALAEQGITLSGTSVGELKRDQQEAFAQSGARRGMVDGSGGETSGLDQIAQRLALMAAFAAPAPSSAPSASPQGVKQIAELLAISEGDAATLIAAFQGQRDARPAVDSASRTAPFSLASAPLATQAQTTTWQPAASQLDAAAMLRAEPATPAWPSMAPLTAPLTTRFEEPSTSMAPLVGAADAASPRLPMSPASTVQTSVATPVQSPAWPQQVGQQLVQFIQRGGEQHVQMQLHPAELGPLSIALTVGEQGTQAHFVSAHAQVRQVLEHALPQLREALAEQGITLSDTSVGDQRRDQQEAFAQSSARRGMAGGSGDEPMTLDEGTAAQRPRSMTLDGRIDLYA
ncbi:flagellar hook-length control protein FliK [Halomonas dongshanensis]|uniref:Flagellar hook-length control protein FliK n=1 Tax=Halomonas dongshanensis TaxID=2890835 RepID=A0ABT2EF79_9GAMM|nr:flagellar hook-length control protein FliK [Halomonas dongshanensis]MCS2610243.1 flagellar hook-length control protein FliK [Halomonas dongshanensis]